MPRARCSTLWETSRPQSASENKMFKFCTKNPAFKFNCAICNCKLCEPNATLSLSLSSFLFCFSFQFLVINLTLKVFNEACCNFDRAPFFCLGKILFRPRNQFRFIPEFNQCPILVSPSTGYNAATSMSFSATGGGRAIVGIITTTDAATSSA